MVKTKEARNPNSRPECTAGVTFAAFSPERVDKRGKVVAHPVGGYVYAFYGKIWRGAVGDVARYPIAFLELDRGSGDTDGCDGKDRCEELSGEHHRWRAGSGRRAGGGVENV